MSAHRPLPFGRRTRFLAQPSAQRLLQAQRERDAVRAACRRVDRTARELRDRLIPGSYYVPPDKPGVYALWLSREGWGDLNLGPVPAADGGWLYTGRSSVSLASCPLPQHLAEGDTRHSGVRRSMAALTQDLFDWEVIPPNPAQPGNYDRYTLIERDEFSLSCWIDAYVHVADLTWPPDHADPEVITGMHAQLNGVMRPLLCPVGRRTERDNEIRARRRRCTRLAQEWATWRGLAPGSSPWSDPPGP